MCCAAAKADVYPCFFQRGKTVPEELVKPEELSKYRQVASHVVSARMEKNRETSTWSWELLLDSLWEVLLLVAVIWGSPSHRGCTAPASQEFLPWICVLPTPTRSSLVRELSWGFPNWEWISFSVFLGI